MPAGGGIMTLRLAIGLVLMTLVTQLGCGGSDRGAEVEQALEEAEALPDADQAPVPTRNAELANQVRMDLTALEGKVAAVAGTAQVLDNPELSARSRALEDRTAELQRQLDELAAYHYPLDEAQIARWEAIQRAIAESAAEADALIEALPTVS